MATSTIKRVTAVQKYVVAPSAITKNTWVDDFLGLPNVSGNTSADRALLNMYISTNGAFGVVEKRASDQKIAFSVDVPASGRVNVSGVIL